MSRRVVVTGMGAITPIGNSVEEFWNGLKEKKVGIAPISLQKFLDLDVCWTVSNSGAVTLALHAERNTVFPELPRFGLRLFLPKEMARVSYYGMGPMESYCDKHHAASHDYFSSTIW